jgi:hypothetical protein
MPAPFGSTTTINRTLRQQLNEGQPNEMFDLLALLELGTTFFPLKRTFTGLTAAASFDLTLIDGTGETTGVGNPNRLAANVVRTLRVTASGTGTSVGSYVTTDAAGTATSPATSTVAGLALISDDGKTITFPTTVTAFIISYLPRALSDAQLAALYPPTSV